jgi:hypothetical protein
MGFAGLDQAVLVSIVAVTGRVNTGHPRRMLDRSHRSLRTLHAQVPYPEVAMMILAILFPSALAADFECVAVVSPVYPDLGEFAFAVEGTLLPRQARPTYIAVIHEDDRELLAERRRPTLFNDYGEGYWLDTYGFNTWRAGRWGTTQFYFLFGTEPVEDEFEAQLHLISAAGGSYAQAMDCRLTG